MSYYLQQLDREHLILERAAVADRWHTQRWDSLMFQFPNWSIRLPGRHYQASDADAFSHRDAIRRFIEDYAISIHAPVRTNTNVLELRTSDHGGYLVATQHDNFEARNV